MHIFIRFNVFQIPIIVWESTQRALSLLPISIDLLCSGINIYLLISSGVRTTDTKSSIRTVKGENFLLEKRDFFHIATSICCVFMTAMIRGMSWKFILQSEVMVISMQKKSTIFIKSITSGRHTQRDAWKYDNKMCVNV